MYYWLYWIMKACSNTTHKKGNKQGLTCTWLGSGKAEYSLAITFLDYTTTRKKTGSFLAETLW